MCTHVTLWENYLCLIDTAHPEYMNRNKAKNGILIECSQKRAAAIYSTVSENTSITYPALCSHVKIQKSVFRIYNCQKNDQCGGILNNRNLLTMRLNDNFMLAIYAVWQIPPLYKFL